MNRDKLIKVLEEITEISYLYTGGGPDLAILRFKNHEEIVDQWWENDKQKSEWIKSIADNIIEQYETE